MAADLDDLKAMWLELRAHVDRLAGERQQYLDFFDQSTEGYVVTDALGRIAEVNGAAVDILQRRKHHLRGKPLAVLIALERRPEFRQRLRALAAKAASEPSWRTVVLAPESRVEVEMAARRISGSGGGICWRLQAVE